ncbi:MAG: TatD family hydrolase [Verrucomicrobia bacterium]|nr:TatD family hydrolase [Verrucomicrobiota bacterium]
MTSPPFVKIDSHAHLTDDELYPCIEEILVRAFNEGVTKIVNINTSQKALERGLSLRQKYPQNIFNAAATTPHDVKELGEVDLPYFTKAAEKGELVAIGETGLDYYYEHSPRDLQKHFCRSYFQLAHRLDLPVIIHCRNAFSDLFALAREEKPVRAVLHCFTGTTLEAQQVLSLGWMISFSGIVTFKKSEDLRKTLQNVPLDRLLIETDAPYLAPQKERGARNEPAFIRETASEVAKVHGVSLETVCQETVKNSLSFFRIL